MTEHVAALGIEVTYANVEKVTREEDGAFTAHTDGDDKFRGRACIYCAGSHPRYLGVPGEQEYRTGGVSYCATCDGFFYKGKDVVVVGGGDAAIEESIYLTKIVNTVRCVHRRDELRAQQVLQDRAFEKENFSVIWDSIVEEIVGENGRVTGVRLQQEDRSGPSSVRRCLHLRRQPPNSEAVRDLWTRMRTGTWSSTTSCAPVCRASTRSGMCASTACGRSPPPLAMALPPPSPPWPT